MTKAVPTQITDMTAAQLSTQFKNKQLSPREVTDAFLNRIDELNPVVNAYAVVAYESARQEAGNSEKRWLQGRPLSPIDGVPCSIKDLTMVAGLPMRSGSLITSENIISTDAPVTARMREAGAVILGKTTTPEFGWKGVTDSPLTGITRNPWNTALTSGGSSGGAAVAAALNMGVLHQGSDGGGSVRIPAGFCGVFGIKPTFGYIPQWPASSMTTLSHIGPLTRTIEDSLLMMDVIAKPDDRDWYSVRERSESWLCAQKPLTEIRIAYSPTLGYASVNPGVTALTDRAVLHLESLGAIVERVDPGFSDPLDMFCTLWFAGAAKVVASMSEEAQQQLDPGFLDIAMQGSRINIVDYMQAVDKRAELGQKMQAFHRDYDVLITPTLPDTAFPVGQNTRSAAEQHWMQWTPFSYPFNLTQQPALSVPCGQLNGLPVGLQVIADRGQDSLAINVAGYIESAFSTEFLQVPRSQ